MADDFPLEHVHVPPGGRGSGSGDRDESEGEGGADAAAPAVVILHGRGADEEDLLGVGRRFADEGAHVQAHVLSVRAPDPLGPGYTWYDLDLPDGDLHQSQPDARDFERSRERLDAFVEAAREAYAVDPDRVGLLGFSQGAILGMGSLLDRPDLYRWVAALHGYLPARYDEGAYADAAGRRAFVTGGAADEVIPVERSERAAQRLRDLGLDVTARTFPTGHGIGPDELDAATGWVTDRLADGP
jgi:phospholipase/carboxylesterase